QQRLRAARDRDPDPGDALGTRVVELGGVHREVVLPAQTVEQRAVAAPGRIRAHDPVVKDGDADGDQLYRVGVTSAPSVVAAAAHGSRGRAGATRRRLWLARVRDA